MSAAPMTRQQVLEVLRHVFDPEMPINIVDLGIVHDVRVEERPAAPPTGSPSRRGSGDASASSSGAGRQVVVGITPTFVGCPALDLLERQVRERVGAMPGVVAVRVQFVHSPPWTPDLITDAGRQALRAHGVTVPRRASARCCGDERAGGPEASVPLTIASPAGGPRGVDPNGAAPRETRPARDDEPSCPFCGSRSTHMESRFGPTRCRMIYYCVACRNSFEHIKAPR